MKFRAWNKESKCMIVDSPISMASIMRDYIRKAYNINQELIGKEYIIMQFTGLSDKNGIEIYEGDVISMDIWNGGDNIEEESETDVFFGVVEWDNTRACYIISGDEIQLMDDEDYITLEIFGNIYENPNLLKGETK